MKKKFKFSNYYFFALVMLVTSTRITFSQNSLKWNLDEITSKNVTEKIPNGKALLIFDSPVELTFDSSIENLEPPTKKSGKYYLFVNKGPQSITIKYKDEYHINFGQLQDPNTLPALKNRDIKYFKIVLMKVLEYYNTTEKELAKGNVVVPIGSNISDALVIFNVFPPDLEIQIHDQENIITKQSFEKGTYKVFIKAPISGKLSVTYPGFDETEIPIKNLASKETRYFLIREPSDFSKNEVEKQDYSKLKGYWSGNLSKIQAFLDIQNISENGVVTGRLYKDGIYSDGQGMVKLKTNEVYQLTFTKKSNQYSNENITLDMIFKKGIGTGVCISDLSSLQDFVVMKVQKVPENKNAEIFSNIYACKDSASYFFSINDYNSSCKYFEKYLASKLPSAPKDGQAYHSLGICYYKLSKYYKALDSFQKAINLDFLPDLNYLLTAQVYKDLGNDGKAKEVVNYAIKNYPNSSYFGEMVKIHNNLLFNEASLLFEEANAIVNDISIKSSEESSEKIDQANEKYKSTIPIFEEILKIDPSNEKADSNIKACNRNIIFLENAKIQLGENKSNLESDFSKIKSEFSKLIEDQKKEWKKYFNNK